jgi:hypothetical protein
MGKKNEHTEMIGIAYNGCMRRGVVVIFKSSEKIEDECEKLKKIYGDGITTRTVQVDNSDMYFDKYIEALSESKKIGECLYEVACTAAVNIMKKVTDSKTAHTFPQREKKEKGSDDKPTKAKGKKSETKKESKDDDESDSNDDESSDDEKKPTKKEKPSKGKSSKAKDADSDDDKKVKVTKKVPKKESKDADSSDDEKPKKETVSKKAKIEEDDSEDEDN